MEDLKLLFAAYVRDLAASARRRAMPDSLDVTDQTAYDEWISTHPITNYVPGALHEIEIVAKQIESLRK